MHSTPLVIYEQLSPPTRPLVHACSCCVLRGRHLINAIILFFLTAITIYFLIVIPFNKLIIAVHKNNAKKRQCPECVCHPRAVLYIMFGNVKPTHHPTSMCCTLFYLLALAPLLCAFICLESCPWVAPLNLESYTCLRCLEWCPFLALRCKFCTQPLPLLLIDEPDSQSGKVAGASKLARQVSQSAMKGVKGSMAKMSCLPCVSKQHADRPDATASGDSAVSGETASPPASPPASPRVQDSAHASSSGSPAIASQESSSSDSTVSAMEMGTPKGKPAAAP